jgi:hypothetical protein
MISEEDRIPMFYTQLIGYVPTTDEQTSLYVIFFAAFWTEEDGLSLLLS